MNTLTSFSEIYDSFLSKITDDMYLQLTEAETKDLLQELLFSAIPKFEFPKKNLEYKYFTDQEIRGFALAEQEQEESVLAEQQEQTEEEGEGGWYFVSRLNIEEINILATYMIVEWLGQQLASIQNVRMKYSGSDFKFTSQANHMQKILQMKKDYEREGFHLQRLYKRRAKDANGIYRSTMPKIMSSMSYTYSEEEDI